MLQCRDVVVAYGERRILERVSLHVPTRGLVGVLGPNGSGKTTLLKVLSGALTPETAYERADLMAFPGHPYLVSIAEIASRDAEAVGAILATAAGPDAARDTLVEVRPGVPGLDPYLGAPQRADWYYVRIPDVATLVNANAGLSAIACTSATRAVAWGSFARRSLAASIMRALFSFPACCSPSVVAVAAVAGRESPTGCTTELG